MITGSQAGDTSLTTTTTTTERCRCTHRNRCLWRWPLARPFQWWRSRRCLSSSSWGRRRAHCRSGPAHWSRRSASWTGSVGHCPGPGPPKCNVVPVCRGNEKWKQLKCVCLIPGICGGPAAPVLTLNSLETFIMVIKFHVHRDYVLWFSSYYYHYCCGIITPLACRPFPSSFNVELRSSRSSLWLMNFYFRAN